LSFIVVVFTGRAHDFLVKEGFFDGICELEDKINADEARLAKLVGNGQGGSPRAVGLRESLATWTKLNSEYLELLAEDEAKARGKGIATQFLVDNGYSDILEVEDDINAEETTLATLT
jgi:hypothetical protein